MILYDQTISKSIENKLTIVEPKKKKHLACVALLLNAQKIAKENTKHNTDNVRMQWS